MRFYINRAQLPFMVELPSKRFADEAWRRLPERRRANGGVAEQQRSTHFQGSSEGAPSDHER